MLAASVGQWAHEVYGVAGDPHLQSRKVLADKGLETAFGESFAFILPGQSAGALAAVSINAPGARKYAATRLRQDVASLKHAPELFLRLMSEHAARALWKRVSLTFSKDAAQAAPLQLVEFNATADALENETGYLCLTYTLGGDGGEDSWLIEGGGDAPEVQLLVKMQDVKSAVRTLQTKAEKTVTSDSGGHDVLRKRVRDTAVVLDAVLDTLPMTIGACSRLEIGQVIALPGAKMDRLHLSAGTVSGSLPISQGELGAWKGFRALKLRTPVPEDVIREIAEI